MFSRETVEAVVADSLERLIPISVIRQDIADHVLDP